MTNTDIPAKLRKIRHVALDMDGTIYMGNTLFPFTIPFLEQLDRMGISWSFLTNNPSKSISDYMDKLAAMGVNCRPDQMYSTGTAAIEYLKIKHPEYKRLYVLGTPSLRQQFRDAGFKLCLDDTSDRPDLLVVAFDTSLVYEHLCVAAYWASQPDIPYIATNPDKVCPTDKKIVLPDCGSIIACLQMATGRTPDHVIGKPNPGMLLAIAASKGLEPDEIMMVGDRLYTDVKSALNAGSVGVLVLSGETTLETALQAGEEDKPTLICRDIAELGELLLIHQG